MCIGYAILEYDPEIIATRCNCVDN